MGAECCTSRAPPSSAVEEKSNHIDSRDHSAYSSLQSSLVSSPRSEGSADDDGLRERIRLATKSLVLDIPIGPRDVAEGWISPVTCKGAAIAMDLVDVIRTNSRDLGFRTYVKRVTIEEGLIGKLLGNFRSANQSLRRASAFLLSHLVVVSQYELVRAFVQEEGVRRLGSLLQGDENEGLVAVAVQMVSVVYGAGGDGATQVLDSGTDIIGVLMGKLRKLRIGTHIQQSLQPVLDLLKQDQAVARQLLARGLSDCLQELAYSVRAGQVRVESTPQLASLQQQLSSMQAFVSKVL